MFNKREKEITTDISETCKIIMLAELFDIIKLFLYSSMKYLKCFVIVFCDILINKV